MNTKVHSILAVILAVLLSGAAHAQPFQHGPAAEKIKQLRRIKMIEALDLTEDQSVRLFAREKEHMKEQKELGMKRFKSVKTLREAIKDETPDEQLMNMVEEIKTIDFQFQQNRYDYIMGLKDLLSETQIAKLIVFEHEFIKEVKSIIKSLKEEKRQPKKRRDN